MVLEDKSVVITGAGQGLGEAYARLAAAEGAAVVVNDIDAAQAERVVAAIRAAGGRASAVVADVASWAGAQAIVDHCVATYGSLDGFVNNAAVFHMATPLEETEAGLRRIVEINVLGTAFCGCIALRQMIRQGRGSLVNVTSGAHAGMPAMGAYGGTKGAAASMTFAWALDTAGTGVRVNAISPIADTRMSNIRDTFNATHGADPVRRPHLDPADIAPVAVYLLSDLAQGITGQIVRKHGRALSLMTHPGALDPVVLGDSWTVQDIHLAFESQLRQRQLPCGMQTYAVELRQA